MRTPMTPKPTVVTETAPNKPKAYSYVRLLTPEQAAGDSYRRQTDLARRYAEAKGLDLDTSVRFDDLGVSAHHGRNKAAGALGAFLVAVNDGTVPQGSYLIVESLDRISRQTPRIAARTLEQIVEAGVLVVDLSDGGKVYDTAELDNGLGFLMMTVRFIRAHDESAQKAIRLANGMKRSAKRPPAGNRNRSRSHGCCLDWSSGTIRPHSSRRSLSALSCCETSSTKADQGWSKHR